MSSNKDILNDPDGHFPYKRDAVLAEVEAAEAAKATLADPKRLSEAAATLGMNPGLLRRALESTASAPVPTLDEVDATDAYVAAQAAFLAHPSEATDNARAAAAEALQAARQARREADGRRGHQVVGDAFVARG